MSTSIGKLTVFFEEPFWVGVFERIENGKLSVLWSSFFVTLRPNFHYRSYTLP